MRGSDPNGTALSYRLGVATLLALKSVIDKVFPLEHVGIALELANKTHHRNQP